MLDNPFSQRLREIIQAFRAQRSRYMKVRPLTNPPTHPPTHLLPTDTPTLSLKGILNHKVHIPLLEFKERKSFESGHKWARFIESFEVILIYILKLNRLQYNQEVFTPGILLDCVVCSGSGNPVSDNSVNFRLYCSLFLSRSFLFLWASACGGETGRQG